MTENKHLSLKTWFAVAGVVFLLDQATKYLAMLILEPHVPVPVLPGLDLTLVFNRGAAFSLLSDAGGWQRWFFSLVTGAIAIFIIIWMYRLPRAEVWLLCALSLVLGGAMGNLWDRLTLGVVVDFIDVHYKDWHWPAFNVADSAISVGAVMLLVSGLYPRKDAEKLF